MAYREVAVVGAGIGGLTAAVALARQNVRCVVFERHPALPDDGAGIQISPNAAAELHELGLAAAFDTAVRPACREIRRWRDNTLLGRTELGPVAERRYGAPYYTLRRTALTGALLDAVRRAHGPSAVRFSRRCAGVRDEGDRVTLGFDDGTTARADAVVGADGLRSAVRGHFGHELPRFRGHVAGRAVLPMDAARPWAEPDRIVVWLGPGRHCVCYPIDRGRHLNLVITTPAARPPGRNTRISGTDLLTRYAGWHPAVRGLLARAGRIDQRALYDRPPMPGWHRGRVVLLGDAAHPMLPFLAQGAAQAIEDAAALARCVHRPDGFARYEELRQDRVRRVVEASAAGLSVHHLPDGDEQRLRDRALAAAPRDVLDWLYSARRCGS